MTQDAKTFTGKPRFTLLLELPGLEDVVRALEHGNVKYQRGSWAFGPSPESAYLDAACRHLFAYVTGEKLDPASGVSHLAHAAASLLIALSKGKLGLVSRDLTFHGRRVHGADAMRAIQTYAATDAAGDTPTRGWSQTI